MAAAIVPMIIAALSYFLVIQPQVEALSAAPFEGNVAWLGTAINHAIKRAVTDLSDVASSSQALLDPATWGDPAGPLTNILDRKITDNHDYRLAILVAPDGSVLGISNGALADHPLDKSGLNGLNVSTDLWFGQVLTHRKDVKPFALALDRIPVLQHLFGDDGIAMPVAVPVRDAKGKVEAFWVDFISGERFSRLMAVAYKNTGFIASGDIAAAYMDYDIVDASNRLLYAFRANTAQRGYFLTDAFGRDYGRDATGIRFDAHAADGKLVVSGKVPPDDDFRGVDWHIVMHVALPQAYATADMITRVVISGMLFSIAAAITIGFWGSGLLTAPVLAVATRLRTLAGGDNDAPVPHADHSDDIGLMARSVLRLKSMATEKMRVEAELAEERRAAAAAQRDNEAARVAAARQRTVLVQSLTAGLEKLAQGDLTYRMKPGFIPDGEKLRTEFNDASEKLRRTMEIVAKSTYGLPANTADIAKVADQLSRRTAKQAASIEKTAIAIGQIRLAIRQITDATRSSRRPIAAAETAALMQVNTEIAQIDRAVSHNASIALDSAAASLKLSVETAALARAVGRVATGAHAAPEALPVRHDRRKAPRPPVLKALKGGDPAANPQSAASTGTIT